MDSQAAFLSQLKQGGVHHSSGEFSLDPVAAFEKMRDHRVDDEAYPYWKFLQTCVVLNVAQVRMSIERRRVVIQALSAHPFPRPGEFCQTLPGQDLAFEPLQSAALALASEDGAMAIWGWEEGEPSSSSLAVLKDGTYHFLEGEEAFQALPRRKRSQPARYRLYFRHDWSVKGGFLERESRLRRRRIKVTTALTRRAQLLPLPLLVGGRLIQDPGLDTLAFASSGIETRKLILARAFVDKAATMEANITPVILDYEICDQKEPHRFLSESYNRNVYYRNIVEERDGHLHPLAQFRRSSRQRTGRFTPVLFLRNNTEGGEELVVRGPLVWNQLTAPKVKLTLPLFPVSFPLMEIFGQPVDPGVSYFVREAIFVPEYAKKSASVLGIVDRGVLIGTTKLDLEIPGVIVVKSRGELSVDLGGASVVKDEKWERYINELRHRIGRTLRQGFNYLEKSEDNGYDFVSEWRNRI